VLVTAINNHTVATAVAVPDVNLVTEVTEGSHIKAVYIEMWITGEVGETEAQFQVMFEKIPAGATAPTFTIGNALTAYVNKKNVFYVTRGIAPISTTTPLPAIKGWFAIPKGKQRMGLGDTLMLSITAITNPLQWCGFFLFKEYK